MAGRRSFFSSVFGKTSSKRGPSSEQGGLQAWKPDENADMAASAKTAIEVVWQEHDDADVMMLEMEPEEKKVDDDEPLVVDPSDIELTPPGEPTPPRRKRTLDDDFTRKVNFGGSPAGVERFPMPEEEEDDPFAGAIVVDRPARVWDDPPTTPARKDASTPPKGKSPGKKKRSPIFFVKTTSSDSLVKKSKSPEKKPAEQQMIGKEESPNMNKAEQPKQATPTRLLQSKKANEDKQGPPGIQRWQPRSDHIGKAPMEEEAPPPFFQRKYKPDHGK